MHPIFRVACSRKAHGAQRARRSAWLTAELLVASYSYFELGNPKGPAEYLRGIGPHEVTAVQQEFCFSLFLDQLCAIGRYSAPEGCSRGRNTLLQAVQHLSQVAPGAATGPFSVLAQAVNPDRISFPKRAGTSRPEDLLRPERTARYQDMELPLSQWPLMPAASCKCVSHCLWLMAGASWIVFGVLHLTFVFVFGGRAVWVTSRPAFSCYAYIGVSYRCFACCRGRCVAAGAGVPAPKAQRVRISFGGLQRCRICGIARRVVIGAGMVEGALEEAVPRLHGRHLTAGLFTAPHKNMSDRLISTGGPHVRPKNGSRAGPSWRSFEFLQTSFYGRAAGIC